MTARPIIFSAPMVRALLDGQKTQTRRVAKLNCSGRVALGGRNWHCSDPAATLACPYGQPGDLLWVRESWSLVGALADARLSDFARDGLGLKSELRLRADACGYDETSQAWRPSIHMPRWASRLTLRLTDVRIERLQEISEEDARAEGAPLELRLLDSVRLGATASHTGGFERLWESIHGPDSWSANPWVWALTFDVIRRNVDEVVV